MLYAIVSTVEFQSVREREILPSAGDFLFHELEKKPKCSEANTAMTKLFIKFLRFGLSMKESP
jgi:hypothetical protein